MLQSIIGFLVMLNPFALFLYLLPIMKELDSRSFYRVLARATGISLVIFMLFLFTGDLLFNDIFRIHFDSFRIFGGIVIFSFSYYFIVRGQRALIQMKGGLDELASDIALPFMVGAGTIPLTILMGHELSPMKAVLSLVIVLVLNFLFITLMKLGRDSLKKPDLIIAYDKNMEILLRLNGFFLGAIGIDMIVSGINNLYLK